MDNEIASQIPRLRSQAADERADAAERLCHAGDAATAAAVPLVTACGDADDRVREWAVAALEGLGAPPSEAIAGLVQAARARVPLEAYWAITLLGRAGQAAEVAAPVLAECLGSGDAAVAQRAAWALGKLGPAAAVARDRLRTAAQSTDARLASLAEQAIESIGPA